MQIKANFILEKLGSKVFKMFFGFCQYMLSVHNDCTHENRCVSIFKMEVNYVAKETLHKPLKSVVKKKKLLLQINTVVK